MRSLPFALVFAAACSADATRGHAGAAGCVVTASMPDAFELAVGHVVTLPTPCSELGAMRFVGPIRVSANEDGLRLQFDVADPAFAAVRTRARARDLATVFPEGEGPGKPTVDLAVDPIAGGYRVDDVVPWETWGLRQPSGAFHLVCVLTDRSADGTELALRLVFHARVRAAD